MNLKGLAPVLLIAVVAACGGTSPGATFKANATSAGGGSTTKPGAKVDCVAISTAAQQLLEIQLLAQLKTPDVIESIKTKAMGDLDLPTFLGAMHELHALDAYPSVLGNPKVAIDFYETAGKAALVLFATDPMTQAAIDTYNQNVGSITDFLGHQAAISGAIGQAGC